MNPIDLPIGVFDSGIGGLTVLSAIQKRLPQESLVYLGDTARVPYGSRSPETIIRYTQRVAGHLIKHGVKALVIACNTATTYGFESVYKKALELDIPVIGVIQPGAVAACKISNLKSIAILGTTGTISGKQYEKEIHKINPTVKVYGKACPLLVPLVEEGWLNDPVTDMIVKRYIDEIPEIPNAIILGCTHYPLLQPVFSRLLPNVTIIDSASVAAESLHQILLNTMRLSNHTKPRYQYLVTDNLSRFRAVGQTFLSTTLQDIELVDLSLEDEIFMQVTSK